MSGERCFFPQGIEVLVKKAAVDARFRKLLVEHRELAAAEIGLDLSPAETAMLRSVPERQLEAIIARTRVPDEHRRAFLGQVAAVMLAALGAGSAEAGITGGLGGIRPEPMAPGGVRPELPDEKPETTVSERVYSILRDVLPIFAELEKKTQAARRPADAKTPAPNVPPDRPPSPQPSKPPAGGEKPENGERDEKEIEPPVPPQTRLVEDLGAKARQLITLRKQLEKEFEITIPYGSYDQMKTVGQVVDYVERAVRRKENAGKPRRPTGQRLPTQPRLKDQPKPPEVRSFGIRPEPPGAFGGVRP